MMSATAWQLKYRIPAASLQTGLSPTGSAMRLMCKPELTSVLM
jgi:hypothetical protein